MESEFVAYVSGYWREYEKESKIAFDPSLVSRLNMLRLYSLTGGLPGYISKATYYAVLDAAQRRRESVGLDEMTEAGRLLCANPVNLCKGDNPFHLTETKINRRILQVSTKRRSGK